MKIVIASCVTFASVIAVPSMSVGMDCSPLDPRASITTTSEGKANLSATTLYKIAKAGGSVESKFQKEMQNLQKGVPLSEQGQVKLRTLYLFCGMVANAKDIPTERKAVLYDIMMNQNKNSHSARNKRITPQPRELQNPTVTQAASPPTSPTPEKNQSPPQISQTMTNSPQGIQAINTGNGNIFVSKEPPPRNFTEEQQLKLLTTLKSLPKGTLALNAEIGEPTAFAFHLEKLLISAGWTVSQFASMTSYTSDGSKVAGLTLEAPEDGSLDNLGGILQHGLKSVGYEVSGRHTKVLGLRLIIGYQ